jgi:L-cysteine S-thiosulfotransferase
VRQSPKLPQQQPYVAKMSFGRVHRRSWRWPYVLWIAAAVAAWTTATPTSTAQQHDPLVAYRIADGAIAEPLTDQPGDVDRGRRIVLDREGGDCIVCHAMPLPQRQFHGTIGPPLDGVGARYSAGALRLRIVDPKAFNANTIMPAYYKVGELHRVLERYRGKPILTAQQVEDVVAYLLTLQ